MREEHHDRCGLTELEGQTLQSTLRKGWYWGGESFKEELLERLGSERGEALPVAKDFRSSPQAKDYGLQCAEEIISEAVKRLDLEGGKREDFERLPRGDGRRVAVAWALAKKTSLKQAWIAERLSMRSAGNVSEQIRRFALKPESELPKPIRKWRDRYGWSPNLELVP